MIETAMMGHIPSSRTHNSLINTLSTRYIFSLLHVFGGLDENSHNFSVSHCFPP
jgi:hypothetical protein